MLPRRSRSFQATAHARDFTAQLRQRLRIGRKRQEAHRPYFHGLRLWLLHHDRAESPEGYARGPVERGGASRVTHGGGQRTLAGSRSALWYR